MQGATDNFGDAREAMHWRGVLGRSAGGRWSSKEFLQLRRDRVTFGMIVGIPIIQLALFGYAINTDPKHMPTALIVADNSEFTRTFVQAMKTSGILQHRRRAARRGSRTRGARAGQRAVRADDSRRLHAQAPARRAARRWCSKPTRPIPRQPAPRWPHRRSWCPPSRARTSTGPLAALAGSPAAVRGRRPPPLQPRVDHAVQHRARPDGRDPDDDAGDDDGPRDHPRARARHDGEPARDADHAARGDDRQDRALHRDRPHPGERSSCSRRASSSTFRSSAA